MIALDQDRIKSAIGVAALHTLLGYAFIVGLGMRLPEQVSSQLKMFDVRPDPPPPPPREEIKPARQRAPKREGAAAPPNKKSVAAPVVAPKPQIVLPVPPPIVAAPVPRLGDDRSAGAAVLPGPGTGSGGQGNGTGSGASGDGPGGGGGKARPERWVSGRLRDSDYPRDAADSDHDQLVGLRFTVGTAGRVTDCAVTRSSGDPVLDRATCRLIIERLRYRPARDARGKPVPAVVIGEQEWFVRRAPDRWVDAVPDEED